MATPVWDDFKVETFALPECDIACHSVGSGPTILLIHGWMGKAYSWRKLAPLLATRARVIVPDMRGYGDSSKPSSGYDARTLKNDLRGLLAAIGVERPLVVGHDMGALPAFLFAADHPDEIAGLAYLDEPLPGYNLDDYTVFAAPLGGFWWFGFNWTPALSELLVAGKERAFVEFIMTAMIADKAALTAADFDEYARTLSGANAIAGSVGWYRDVLISADQIRSAGRLPASLPLLALGGEYGISGTFDQMHLVHDQPEGGIIPGCGHLLAEEKPAELAAALIAFMERHAIL